MNLLLVNQNTLEDVFKSYDLGANSYITKPVTFDKLVDLVKQLSTYWFKIVKLPEYS